MSKQIRKVAVLGAGVMGSGIAAHLANAGIPSLLFDLEKPTKSIAALSKTKPAPLYTKTLSSLIEPCSFEADSARLGECEWIVEAVTERLDVKRSVFENVRKHASPSALITSNTSGIPIAAMTEGAPESFKKNFFVTHFFNPVRYMKLLELVAGPETDNDTFQSFAEWGERTLGKGIVVGKDTPNFVANRIGTYGLMRVIHRATEMGLSVPQVDKIFGKPMGRPSSAIFRTADIVGLDTLAHVAKNCLETLTDDPHRTVFELPSWVQGMLDKGLLGEKTGQGFYKKTRGADGKREILALNPKTLEYEVQEKVRFDSLGAIKDIEDPGQRLNALFAHDDAAAKLAWEATADVLLYSAELLGQIADDVVNIDRAMRWGFAWDMGPFESWDAIGLVESVERMKAEGRSIPEVVGLAVQAGGWYERQAGTTRYLDALGNQERKPVPQTRGAISLADLKEQGKVVAQNPGATLVDLGDGVLGLEFHTKMNAVDDDIIGLYNDALDRLDGDWSALVVGNEGQHFSAGANIMLIMMASMNQEWGQIEALTRGFQDVNMRAKFHRKPVVTAPFGMTLGGGCEIAIHSAATRAAGEMYCGLVEVGVGLLPAGGGCKEMLWRTVGSIPEGVQVDTSPFVQKVFQLVGMAQVSTSAEEARGMGFLRPTDGVTINSDTLIADAKAVALGLAQAGYRPPEKKTIRLPGPTGTAAIKSAIWGFEQAGQISEYDALIGGKIAHVLCGGNTSPSVPVTEQQILDLEREGFLSLCGEEKTVARIQHMLMKGKPLRN